MIKSDIFDGLSSDFIIDKTIDSKKKNYFDGKLFDNNRLSRLTLVNSQHSYQYFIP